MAYDGKVMRQAFQEFDDDRRRRQAAFDRQREEIFRRQPRLRQIESRLGSTMSRILAGALRRGKDPKTEVEALRRENLALQAEKRRLLTELGLPETALDETPFCPLCGDSGYVGERVCKCLKSYYARAQQRELSRMLDLGSQSFDTFDLEWYANRREPGQPKSAREHMEERVYNCCAEYASHFGKKMENLLFFGAPGLGKTHLSAAIAREVSGKGFSVVYDTAGNVFSRFEAEKFSWEENDEIAGDVARVMNCDLLILDDLGTEMATSFVRSALYRIVNTRLMEKRSTIISTNLSPDKLAERYGGQIASRLQGEYQLLPFVGQDIRQLKKQGKPL